MAGLSMQEDGLLLDLRAMDAVELAGERRTTARIGGGALWGHVAAPLSERGLALTAGDTASVGVGGLTRGGGIGWMVREYGLAIDSLVGAEVVTADGAILEVSGAEHPDLFWALRGGGGNFGIVTRFDFEAHPVSDVVFGTVMFALDGIGDASPMLTRWWQAQADADERLTSVLSLLPPMGDQPAMAMLQLCFHGSEEAAASIIEPLLHAGAVIHSDLGVKPYASILVAPEPFPLPRAAQRNVLLRRLGETERAAVADAFATGGLIFSVRALGGAFSRVPASATAFAFRSAEVMVVATRMLPADASAQQGGLPGWDGVDRLGVGSYVNFLDSARPVDGIRCYPPDTRRRLAAVKTKYDPDNVFSHAVPVR